MAKRIKIVRKDKLLAGYNGNLESVIVYNSNGDLVETYNGEGHNGAFVTVGALLPNQREVKKAVLAGEDDADNDILFIHNSEVMYDEREDKLEDFFIPKNTVTRAYRLFDGDVITLTKDFFSESVAVGDTLTPKLNGLLGKGDGTEKVVFTVTEDSGNQLHNTATAFAVEVSRR